MVSSNRTNPGCQHQQRATCQWSEEEPGIPTHHYSRQTEEIRKLLGASLDIKKSREFGYVDRALSSLINRSLFNNEALELGLSVSDRNVKDKILSDDAFKDDLGQFSEL